MSIGTLPPHAEVALDVAAARHALRSVPESYDLLDKVRAVELAVRLRRAAATPALAALLSACGAGEPPAHYSIDPAFSESERATIEAAVEAWCPAVGQCPERVLWSERGRITLVDSLPLAPGACPPGEECRSAGENDGDNVHIAADRFGAGSLSALWVTIAHEWGHYCAGHTATGLMAKAAEVDAPAEIDALAIAAWRMGCP